MISLPPLAAPDIAAVRLLLRRLAAILYDALLLLAVLFFASLPPILLGGGAISSGNPGYQLYLLAIIFLYLGWHWTHGGQTLGMKSWRLKAVAAAGRPLDWQDSLLRFLAALFSVVAVGIGYLWILVDRDRLAWHDRLSGTKLIDVNREM